MLFERTPSMGSVGQIPVKVKYWFDGCILLNVRLATKWSHILDESNIHFESLYSGANHRFTKKLESTNDKKQALNINGAEAHAAFVGADDIGCACARFRPPGEKEE